MRNKKVAIPLAILLSVVTLTSAYFQIAINNIAGETVIRAIHGVMYPETTKPRMDDMTTYYGCPNSKKVKKLSLLKSLRKLV